MYLSELRTYRFDDGTVHIGAEFTDGRLDSGKSVEVRIVAELGDPIIPTLEDLEGLIKNRAQKLLEAEDVA